MRRGAAVVCGIAVLALFWWLLAGPSPPRAALDAELGSPGTGAEAPPREAPAAREVPPPIVRGADSRLEDLRERVLRVRVVRSPDGRPVAGASIHAWQPEGREPVAALRTDAAGTAVVSLHGRLRADAGYRRYRSACISLELMVTAPGLGPVAVRNWEYVPGEWWEIVLAPPVVVSGVVRDDHGRAVRGARIGSDPVDSNWAAAQRGPRGDGPSTVTDANGRYRLPLGPGVWAILADADGYATDSTELWLREAATRHDITLRPCPRTILRVVDDAGAGVRGATVVYRHPSTGGWMQPPFHAGTTGRDGRLVVPGRWALELEDTVGEALAFDPQGGLYCAQLEGPGTWTLWPLGHPNDRWGADWSAWDSEPRFLSGAIDWGSGPPPDHIQFGLGQTQQQYEEMVAQSLADAKRRGDATAPQWRSWEETERHLARGGVSGPLWSERLSPKRFQLVWFQSGDARLYVRGVGPGARIRFAAQTVGAGRVHRDVRFSAGEIVPDPELRPVDVSARLVWDRDGRPAAGIASTLGRGGVSDAAGLLRIRVEPWAASAELLPARWRTTAPPAGGWPGIAQGSDPVELGTLRVLPRERLTLELTGPGGERLRSGSWELAVSAREGGDVGGWRRENKKSFYVPPMALMAQSRNTGSLPADPSVWIPDAPGSVKLTVSIEGHEPWSRRWQWSGLPKDRRVVLPLTAKPARPHTPAKPPLATLTGSFVDGTGNPLAGVRAGHGWGGGARMSIVRSPWGYRYSDATGRLLFPLTQLDTLQELKFPVSKAGFVSRTVHLRPLPNGQGYPSLKLALERAHRLVIWLPGTIAEEQFHWRADGKIEARAVAGVAATYRVPEADGGDGRPWWSSWNAGDRHTREGDRWRVEIGDLVPGTYEVVAQELPGASETPVRVTIQRGRQAEVVIPAAGR